MPIITLVANTDYLKRIKEIVADVADGITVAELLKATDAAEATVKLCLVDIGFDIATFTTEANTPKNVAEIIRIYGSALVWHRMLLMYNGNEPFEATFGQVLLEMANKLLDEIAQRKLLLANDNVTVIRPSVAQGGGVASVRSSKLGIRPNAQIVPDAEINAFIHDHGPNHAARHQADPFNKL